jgi:hypothetical protein
MGKRWTKERCRLRYVQGQRIGLHALAAESGVPLGSLKRWSCAEEVMWPEQRRRFDAEVRLLSHQKSIERVSDAIANSNEQAIAQHLELGKTLREITMRFFDAVLSKLKAVETETPDPERNQQLLEFLSSIAGRCPLAVYSNVAHYAVQLERQALYLDFVDPSILEKAANRQGLTLVSLDRP